MALKIWHIGKANARIEELEAENKSLQEQLKSAQDASAGNATEVAKAAEDLQTKLTDAGATISSQAKELEVLKASISAKDAEIANLKEDIANQAKSVEVKVSQKLLDAQASIGQPPAALPPVEAAKPKTELFGLARFIAVEKAQSAKTQH